MSGIVETPRTGGQLTVAGSSMGPNDAGEIALRTLEQIPVATNITLITYRNAGSTVTAIVPRNAPTTCIKVAGVATFLSSVMRLFGFPKLTTLFNGTAAVATGFAFLTKHLRDQQDLIIARKIASVALVELRNISLPRQDSEETVFTQVVDEQ